MIRTPPRRAAWPACTATTAFDRRALVDVPRHVVLTEELTSVVAPTIVVLGDSCPLIEAHKVGGVAISSVLGCRGAAVLPERMSAKHCEWLARWTNNPADLVRTPGTESNVKEPTHVAPRWLPIRKTSCSTRRA